MLMYKWLLFIILLFALAIRLYSINYGLPYVVGPDETRQILDTLGMASRLSLIPQDFAYASLHKYLLLVIYGCYFIIGILFGVFKDKLDFAFQFLSAPYNFYLLARLLSAVLGTAVIAIVYKTAEFIYNKKVALLAAIFAALNFHLVQLSCWVSSDILLVFFSSLSFFYFLKLMRQANFVITITASLCVGLAISSKFQGVMLIVPLGATLLVTFYRDRRLLKMILISTVVVFISSFIGNAQYLIEFKDAMIKFEDILKASQFGISSAPLFSHNIFNSSTWYFKALIQQDGLLGLLFCLGCIYALIKLRIKENYIFIVFLFTFLIFFSRSSLRYVYYGALILPICSIFSAKFVSGIQLNSKTGRIFVTVLIFIVIIFSLADDTKAAYRRLQLDTRQIAKEWVENNIPGGEKVAIDWYELSVPLESDIPSMIRTGNAIKYYNDFIPMEVKERFDIFITNRGKFYKIIPVIYEKRDDFWPKDMPENAKDRIAKFGFARRLYSLFNFLGLEELKDRGVKYLIVSSYSYSHFLLDDDPNKTELFNPYLREDTLINNRQAKTYDPATKESILFFLTKRSRDFYVPILSSADGKVTLIKSFKPNRFNLGPVIKIYMLN